MNIKYAYTIIFSELKIIMTSKVPNISEWKN